MIGVASGDHADQFVWWSRDLCVAGVECGSTPTRGCRMAASFDYGGSGGGVAGFYLFW